MCSWCVPLLYANIQMVSFKVYFSFKRHCHVSLTCSTLTSVYNHVLYSSHYVLLMRQQFSDRVLSNSRGAEPICGDSYWIWSNQCSPQLGPSSAADGYKLLHWILCPAQGRAPHRNGTPDTEFYTAERPPTWYNVLGHHYCQICLRQGESHVCQSVHWRRWVTQPGEE